MKIRSQLLLAFLVLSVLPLCGVVGYSFYSSHEGIQRAATAEAKQLSQEMRRRVGAARQRLEQRLAQVPWDRLIADSSRPVNPEVGDWLREALGEDESSVRGLTVLTMGGEGQSPQPTPVWQLQLDHNEDSSSNDEAARLDIEAAVRGLERRRAARPMPPRPSRPPAFPRDASPVGPVSPGAEGTADPRRPSVGELELEGLGLDAWQLDGASIDLDLDDIDLGAFELEAAIAEGLDRGLGAAAEAMEGASDGSVEGRAGEDIARWALEMARRATAVQAEQRQAEHEARRAEKLREKARLVLGDNPGVEITEGGEVIGRVRPEVDPERLLSRIFAEAEREPEEIPFALDSEGRLYTEPGGDRRRLLALGVSTRDDDHWFTESWVVASSVDPVTGLRLGVARPMGDSLRELRTTSLRNLIAGLLLIFLAVLGMLPLSHRLSAGIQRVASGAERIARGDLDTRLPVTGGGEMAHLARSFNSMASDLRQHQDQLVAEERLRRDREVEQEVMQRELERQSTELEEARQFQLSLLPQRLPHHPSFDVAVHHETATEVGGDYYDFSLQDDGRLVMVLGDATGHGARAGTMVTVIKSLFSGLTSTRLGPSEFLTEANRAVRRMHLDRMTMALVVVELDRYRLRIANAGIPPILHHEQASGRVEEVMIPGMPLGGLANDYDQQVRIVAPGDTLLLFSDGLPEQPNVHGEPTGYSYVSELFASLVSGSVGDIAKGLAAAVRELTHGKAPFDDVSFVVLRVR